MTVHRNPRRGLDRRTFAKGKVEARVRLSEQVLWIKEGYENH